MYVCMTLPFTNSVPCSWIMAPCLNKHQHLGLNSCSSYSTVFTYQYIFLSCSLLSFSFSWISSFLSHSLFNSLHSFVFSSFFLPFILLSFFQLYLSFPHLPLSFFLSFFLVFSFLSSSSFISSCFLLSSYFHITWSVGKFWKVIQQPHGL